MLSIGKFPIITNDPKRLVTFNLSSMYEQFKNLDILPPPSLIVNNTKEFDMQYANYLLTNDSVFVKFFSIMMVLYYDHDVHILIGKDYCYDEIAESLTKLIQQRYGILTNMINTPEDVEYMVESELSLQGTYFFDMDKERYSLLTVKPEEINQDE